MDLQWQDNVKIWSQNEELDEDLRVQLQAMDDETLADAFGASLNFGTAGMRGLLGPGPNRMNRYTVRQATEGLAHLIEAKGAEAKQRGVVLAYDSRHYSSDFAMEAARVLGHHGIQSYLYESLRPTPVLSFAVRYLNAYAGIMITASHNPKEYNGYKVYGADGGQMPPEEADRLIDYVRAIENPLTVPIGDKKDLLGSGYIEIIGDRVDQAYLEEMKAVTVNPDLVSRMGEEVSLVFTPIHGTGLYLGQKALDQAGFKKVHIVESQAQADGDFPTVDSPNPENDRVFDLAEQLGRHKDADILLATDPDADRLGAKIKTSDGDYQLLTGNQIAALMLNYLLQARKDQGTLPENGAVVKSIVSTKLADAIAQAYDVEMIEVLTGFKFIAEKIEQFERTGSHEFLMGFEESYGYLIKPFVRDKDAIQALVLLAELTAYYKEQGLTLADALESMYDEYGYFYEETVSLAFPGLSGQEKMRQLMADIRQSQLAEVGGLEVLEVADYLEQTLSLKGGKQLTLDYPVSDALRYTLEDGSWVAFRPSGTEPVIKLYMGIQGADQAEVMAKAEAVQATIQELTE